MKDYVIWDDEKEKIAYEVLNKTDEKVVIAGINYRKIVQTQLSSIKRADESLINSEMQHVHDYESCLLERKKHNGITGTVLHFDSDINYLKKCIDLYEKVGIYCYPVLSQEKEYVKKIKDIKFIPDVVVITGHDFYNGEDKRKMESYTNSQYFADTVKKIKMVYPCAVVVAGACQSNFEALIANGADFASSPKRKNVHLYDPVVIAISVCTTSFRKIVDFNRREKYIKEIKDAYNGLETYGKMRLFY